MIPYIIHSVIDIIINNMTVMVRLVCNVYYMLMLMFIVYNGNNM